MMVGSRVRWTRPSRNGKVRVGTVIRMWHLGYELVAVEVFGDPAVEFAYFTELEVISQSEFSASVALVAMGLDT